MTNSEQIISLLSKSYFYEEFTFSDLVFTKKDVGDLEFSDTVVKFNDNLLFKIRGTVCHELSYAC